MQKLNVAMHMMYTHFFTADAQIVYLTHIQKVQSLTHSNSYNLDNNNFDMLYFIHRCMLLRHHIYGKLSKRALKYSLKQLSLRPTGNRQISEDGHLIKHI